MLRTILSSLVSGCFVLVLSACSSQPRAAEQPAPANPPASGLSKKILSDYKLRMKDGKKYYCTKEAVLGSHFEKTVCLTEEQVAEVEERRLQQRDDLEKAQKACGGKMCTGGP